MCRVKTGKRCSSISSWSRTPPSTTRPPMPLILAAKVARPPQVETAWPRIVDDDDVAGAGRVDHVADLEVVRREVAATAGRPAARSRRGRRARAGHDLADAVQACRRRRRRRGHWRASASRAVERSVASESGCRSSSCAISLALARARRRAGAWLRGHGGMSAGSRGGSRRSPPSPKAVPGARPMLASSTMLQRGVRDCR